MTDGYSLVHRVIAGIFGVQLFDRENLTNTGSPDALTVSDGGSNSFITDAMVELATQSASTRLRTRRLILDLAISLDDAERFVRDLDQGYATDEALGFSLDSHDAIRRATEIGIHLEMAEHLAHKLAASNRSAQPLARVLTNAIRRRGNWAQRPGDSVADDLASASRALTMIASNFRGEDLSLAFIGIYDAYLVGVRWDTTTKWPVGWRGRIQNSSEEVQGLPGVYVITTEPATIFSDSAPVNNQ